MDLSELLDWTEYTKLPVGLLAMVNPLSVIPVYLGLTQQHTPAERKRIIWVATATTILTLLAFTFLAEALLDFFGITLEAFQIAGGLLLLLTALEMMREKPNKPASEDGAPRGATLGIAPLGIPLLAGPAAMSTVIVYSHQHPSFTHDLMIVGAAVLVTAIVFLALKMAPVVNLTLGKTGMNLFNRVMGLLIATIGVEFIIDGLAAHFPGWLQ